MVDKAKGKDVVQDVDRKIKSISLFPDDHGLLVRMSYVLTSFGEDPDTFTAKKNIWHFTSDSALQEIRDFSELKPFHTKINQHFNIDWSKVQLSNLTKPLISGLAARLWIQYKVPVVPISLEDQAQYVGQDWGGTNAQNFINKVRKLENLQVLSSTARPTTPHLSEPTPSPVTSTPAPEEGDDGLLGIKNKARNIAKNAFNTLKDYNQIANQICNELSKLYSKEEWICVVGEKLSISEHQIPKSLFQFGFNMGTADVYIVVNVP